MWIFDKLNNIIFFLVLVTSLLTGLSISLISFKYGYTTFYILIGGFSLSIIAIDTLPVVITNAKRVFLQFRWWNFLWLFIFFSGMVFRVRGVETITENPLDFWAFYRVSLVSIVAFVLIGRLIIWERSWVKSLFRGLIGLITGYALLSMISTIWSVFPLWTLYKSTEYLVDVALIAAIVTSLRSIKEYKTLFDWHWLLVGFSAVTVLLGVLICPEQSVYHGIGLIGFQVRGVLPAISANGVGAIGAILAIVAFTRLLYPTANKRFYWTVFFGGIALLVLSQSRSALVGLMIALPLVLFAARRIGIVVLTGFLLIGILFLTNIDAVFWQFFLRGQNPDLFKSLSGRVNWWKFGWGLYKEQPLIGYGGYAGSRFAILASLNRTFTSSIHNTWFEVLFGTGIFGMIPMVGAFFGIWIILIRSLLYVSRDSVEHRLIVESIGVFSLLSVRSLFTSALIWHPSLIFLLVLGYAEFLRRNYKNDTDESVISSQPLPATWR